MYSISVPPRLRDRLESLFAMDSSDEDFTTSGDTNVSGSQPLSAIGVLTELFIRFGDWFFSIVRLAMISPHEVITTMLAVEDSTT